MLLSAPDARSISVWDRLRCAFPLFYSAIPPDVGTNIQYASSFPPCGGGTGRDEELGAVYGPLCTLSSVARRARRCFRRLDKVQALLGGRHVPFGQPLRDMGIHYRVRYQPVGARVKTEHICHDQSSPMPHNRHGRLEDGGTGFYRRSSIIVFCINLGRRVLVFSPFRNEQVLVTVAKFQCSIMYVYCRLHHDEGLAESAAA